MFAYCNNNPIVHQDYEGESAVLITMGVMAIGGLVGAVVSAACSALTQHALTGAVNWNSVGVAAAAGFLSGAIAASPLGITGQVVAGGIIGTASYAADCYVNDKTLKMDEAIGSFVMGSVSGYIGGPGANSGMVLTDTIENMGNVIAREARRANQEYAAKAIERTMYYASNIISSAAWDASVRFAAGCGISNGVTTWYSSLALFPDLPQFEWSG